MSFSEVVIIGAGPCGLGAGWRFKEKGFSDFLILEASDHPGGLASSFTDDQGFTWDIGGHVQFSHYEDFDRVMDLALPNQWYHHQRESWVWIKNRFVPYPFQNNLWRLDQKDSDRCLKGLEELAKESSKTPKNFGEWIDQSFGKGIAELFMRPYNFKVWAYPPEMMSYQWIGERVAKVNVDHVRRNIERKKDEVSWGPNVTFRYPKNGGTGAIWKSVAQLIGEDKIRYRSIISEVLPHEKKVKLINGDEISYRSLLSTISLNKLCDISGISMEDRLVSSNVHIIGIGLKGNKPHHLKTKCWIYFPESNCPFYRVTVFSNYSAGHVPDPDNHWSLMCEISDSVNKPAYADTLIDETIHGLINTKLIETRDQIVSTFHVFASPGYPTPTIKRDRVLKSTFDQLKERNIFSRGRFGAWKYEVSNQDHTFMQGFEWADFILEGKEEVTVFSPEVVNAPGQKQSLRK